MATVLQNAQTQQSPHNAHNNIEREIVFYTYSFPYECTFQQLLLLRPLIASSTNRHEKYLTTDVLYAGSGRNVISFNIQAAEEALNSQFHSNQAPNNVTYFNPFTIILSQNAMK